MAKTRTLADGCSAIGKVGLFHDCYLYTSARRYIAMGKREVFRLYVRNFVSELLHHRPKDTAHIDVGSDAWIRTFSPL